MVNKGFHDSKTSTLEKLALITSEVGDAVEATRIDQADYFIDAGNIFALIQALELVQLLVTHYLEVVCSLVFVH